MIKAFYAIALSTLMLISAVAPASADMGLNRQIINPVLIRDTNGAVYLSTQAENELGQSLNATSSTAAVSSTSASQQLRNVEIAVPRGFATTFSGLINGILSFVLIISALLVLFYLLWGGFDWITSGGDKGKTEKARNKIVAAVIGLLIVAASFAVLNLVIRFLGFSTLNDVFDSAGTINGGARPPQASDSATSTSTQSGLFR